MSTKQYAVALYRSISRRKMEFGLTRIQMGILGGIGMVLFALGFWPGTPIPVALFFLFRSMNEKDEYAFEMQVHALSAPEKIDA